MSYALDSAAGSGLQVGSAMATAVSRKDAVRIEIRRSIILGTLRPGDKLTEAQLSERLRVSRPTIREALNALAEEGLVTREAYRGMRVAELEPEAIHDIAVARIALDMVAVDAILADGTGKRFAIIERGWLRYEIDAFDPDPVVQHDAHLEFHRCIWEASGNYMLERLWPVTAAQLTIALAEDQRHRADPEREHRVHLTLMEALRTRDREVIRQAVSAHTLASADELVRMMLQERAEQG